MLKVRTVISYKKCMAVLTAILTPLTENNESRLGKVTVLLWCLADEVVSVCVVFC